MTLTVGSLFSGIGGLDLGLERADMRVIWQSEVEPYCCKVLAKHWPDVPNLGDVRAVDWSTVERPDVICGGYPCQPFSLAGARRGETDERHLWPAMRDAIRVLRPRYALLENVPGHLSLGFGAVLGDLADVGYDAEWDCIPAAAAGAPHLRYRLFVVAYPNRESEPGRTVDAGPRRRVMVPDTGSDELREQPVPVGWRGSQAESRDDGPERIVADSCSSGRESRERVVPGRAQPDSARRGAELADAYGASRGEPWSSSEALRGPEALERLGRRGGSLGDHWAVEPDVGRVADGVPCRVDRLRALGNAVVPQVAEWIGERIMEAA